MTKTAYDLVHYPTGPKIDTHPARLGTLGKLRGLSPATFAKARVLEIACGDGGNLISMALTQPDATFVGFDLAAAPIEAGQAAITALGLANIDLRVLDLMTAGPDLGQFDYIIAHGIYSWVPKPVRDAVMRLIGACLSPAGLAFVSYNALPGCHLRQIIRDLLIHEIGHIADPSALIKAAVQLVEVLIASWREDIPLERALIYEARLMLSRSGNVFFHDELGQVWDPQYLHQVVGHARAHGLEYLCDTNPTQAAREGLTPYLATKPDLMAREQLEDFAVQRRFRQSVLYRPNPEVCASVTADWRKLEGLFASTILFHDAEAGLFRSKNSGEVQTSDADMLQQLLDLSQAAPSAVQLGRLTAEVGEGLLQLNSMGLVKFLTEPLTLVRQPGLKPTASPLARYQISLGQSDLTALDHRTVQLPDPGLAKFISLLDGTRTRLQIAAAMEPNLAPESFLDRVEEGLQRVSEAGLLMG